MPSLDLSAARWTFRDAATKTWLPAQVPGCVHTDLHRAGKIPDPFFGTNELDLQWIEERDWEYRATFNVTRATLAEAVVELVADGLDTLATVTLNGKKLAATDNMFIGWRWDVKRRLKVGRNELTIRFASAAEFIRTHRLEHQPKEFNDPVGRCSTMRKQQCQFGWDWGPRFVSAGVWRSLRIESWSAARLTDVRVTQAHGADGVRVRVAPEHATAAKGKTEVTYYVTMDLEGKEVASAAKVTGAPGSADEATDTDAGLALHVKEPQLWWPNDHGAQPLYRVTVELRDADGAVLDRWTRRIGLRTIELERKADEWGESFAFVVNGRRVFAKGANWIPANAFVTTLARADYARDIQSAADAHMNMLRIWGGGIYESEDFYDLCDERGLLVWHDFMFACTLYPGDEAFLRSVRAEAEFQVRRIRHRACLALWCGNNEIETLNWDALKKDETRRRKYDAVFHRVLPEVVAAEDGVTPYWPTSPYRGEGRSNDYAVKELGEKTGDTHFWDVWHARHPVKDYEKWNFRFVSEFGMQSYASPATQATFCAQDDANVFGATMENHQKNRAGNQIILDYVSRRYRFPKDQDALIYLSQLNQAYCMQMGVEHYRRTMPRCMGALYWQLNDCWPVASWSSLEFTGRWKALQHVARRFFAPALVTAHVPGDEAPTIGNYRRTTVREVHVYTVYDAPEKARGTVSWELCALSGERVLQGKKAVALNYGESVKQASLDLAPAMTKYGRDNLYLRIALDIGGRVASEETVFLTPPRFVALPRAKTKVAVKWQGKTAAELTFTSDALQHRFAFEIAGAEATARSSDNYFELYPGRAKTVEVTLAKPLTAAQLKARLRWRSLADSYV
ncbi:glycoside hydrolase family 2 protein [Horticoccus luteus]|uniref:Beta-mannosidase B n=1 Tax=Horticoccus luteus TaxID=2862869 RepID=A0A8F9TUG6_9BACT|nr:glycoside hydrolase family 2 protein [Horticoccus luteus]QYM78312.1 glycoside hydrolase family 2 protein [Horticoccus luteus]